jgi:glucose-6-phosphate 1-dehydrogenase
VSNPIPHGVKDKSVGAEPIVIVMFGATGDLARRKLLPGLFHLSCSNLAPEIRIIGTSLDELDSETFRKLVSKACNEFSHHDTSDEALEQFTTNLTYVPLQDGPEALAHAVAEQSEALGGDAHLLHYLSVPPAAVMPVMETLQKADLVENSRVIMEKPFGVDLASARKLNAAIHEIFDEEQIFRIDHFLGKEAAQNILAFRFANGLFEPIWNRTFIDHIQIDVPEQLTCENRAGFYESVGAFKDMVVTHLFQILAFVAMEPPTELASESISEEKNKVFRSMRPLDPSEVVRGQYRGYRDEPGVAADSDTETFVALKAEIDNWRWAGVPFFLRTGKGLAEGQRIISIAFHEPPRSMFPPGSGVGQKGPDHLTFDLADVSKMSLSFYGKRPGPGMKLDKLSLQFTMEETGHAGDVLEAYERLILDAMRGDRTLYNTAEGIERLWEVSAPLLEDPPPVRSYDLDSWGPNAVHPLIAPRAWRLPFERGWRGKD